MATPTGNGITAWSYSRWADYERCPLRFKLKYIMKIKTSSNAAMDRGSTVHKIGEDWLAKPGKAKVPKEYENFKEEMLQLKALKPLVEQQWGFTQEWEPTSWFGNATWLRIVCDVAVRYDDGTADIIDFKTGRKYETNQDQMDLFSTSAFMMWPDVNEVTTRLWYLDQPKPDNVVEQEFTRGDFDRLKKQWSKKVVPMFVDKKFPPKPNDKCKWCDFRKQAGGPCVY